MDQWVEGVSEAAEDEWGAVLTEGVDERLVDGCMAVVVDAWRAVVQVDYAVRWTG